jgi:hypothetical protein
LFGLYQGGTPEGYLAFFSAQDRGSDIAGAFLVRLAHREMCSNLAFCHSEFTRAEFAGRF